jgi:hypothetical protein
MRIPFTSSREQSTLRRMQLFRAGLLLAGISTGAWAQTVPNVAGRAEGAGAWGSLIC